MSEPTLLRKLVVQPLPDASAGHAGPPSKTGFPGVNLRRSGHDRKRAAGGEAAGGESGWGVCAIGGLHVPRGSNQRNQELKADLGDGLGPRPRFTKTDVPLAWQICLQRFGSFEPSALRHVDFPKLFRLVAEGEPGAADFLALCTASAARDPNPAKYLRLMQLGALLRQQEEAAGSGPQQAPGQPSGERTAEDRLRPHIMREAQLRLRAHLPPRSGTVQHIFGRQMPDFLTFSAQRQYGSTFPGTAKRTSTLDLLDSMVRAGVRAGAELEEAVAELGRRGEVPCWMQLEGFHLYGKSELPSREQLQQLSEGHPTLRLAFDHCAPSHLMDPTGPTCRPPGDDLRLLCVFNESYVGLALPEVLNAAKSCGTLISLPLLLARHPDLEGRQSPATRHHLHRWRQLGQLGNYLVHIRSDGQPAAVVTKQQWEGLRTQEGFCMRLRAEEEREYRAQRAAPDGECGCPRCGSGEAAQAETISADLSNALALLLYDTFGVGATPADLRRQGPATRQVQHDGHDLPRLRCCAASGSVRLRLSGQVLADAGLAPAGPPQPAAAGEEAAAAEAAEEEAAEEEAAASDEGDAGGADAGGAAAAQRPPLQLEQLADAALTFAASFLEQCECPPSHPQHSAARPRCALRALLGLWRSWDAIPEQVQHDLLRLLGFRLTPAAAAAAAVVTAEAAVAEALHTPDPPASGMRSGGSDDDEEPEEAAAVEEAGAAGEVAALRRAIRGRCRCWGDSRPCDLHFRLTIARPRSSSSMAAP